MSDLLALDSIALLPRVIGSLDELETAWRDAPGPLLSQNDDEWPLRLSPEPCKDAIWLLPPLKMPQLMPLFRQARQFAVRAVGIDFALLTESTEYRPRSSEELSELKAAAGLPFIIAGLIDPRDAELAVEIGAEAVIACSKLARRLGGLALPRLVPDLRDTLGETELYVRGGLRHGLDVLRYLALGADAVVVPPALQPHYLLKQLQEAMRLSGCRSLGAISYDLIFEPTYDRFS